MGRSKGGVVIMTNELEKQFFQCFGIEPKVLIFKTMNCACGCHDCKNCDKYKNNFSKTYPQITDHILLELIFILTTLLDTTVYEDVFITIAKNREELKKDIFQECMLYKQHIKHQVRTLFEEG